MIGFMISTEKGPEGEVGTHPSGPGNRGIFICTRTIVACQLSPRNVLTAMQ